MKRLQGTLLSELEQENRNLRFALTVLSTEVGKIPLDMRSWEKLYRAYVMARTALGEETDNLA